MTQNITGAGIVTVLDNTDLSYTDLPKDYLYLVLVDNKDMYDFPKGGIDEGEYGFDCALRETAEECNIKKSDYYKFYTENVDEAFVCGKGLYMFLGMIQNISNIKILKNPKYDIYEHKGFKFLTYEQIIRDNLLYDYLLLPLKMSNDLIKQGIFK